LGTWHLEALGAERIGGGEYLPTAPLASGLSGGHMNEDKNGSLSHIMGMCTSKRPGMHQDPRWCLYALGVMDGDRAGPVPCHLAHLAPASSSSRQSPLGHQFNRRYVQIFAGMCLARCYPHPACAQTARGVPRPGLRRAPLSTPLAGLPNQQNSARFCFLFSPSKVTGGGGGRSGYPRCQPVIGRLATGHRPQGGAARNMHKSGQRHRKGAAPRRRAGQNEMRAPLRWCATPSRAPESGVH
jgi:hypothetical protein